MNTDDEDWDWKAYAERQEEVIEGLSALCRELIDELMQYRSTEEIDGGFEKLLRR